MPHESGILEILKAMRQNNKPDSPEVRVAGWKLALNPWSREAVKEYLEAKRRSRR